jgi:hypothetical protein
MRHARVLGTIDQRVMHGKVMSYRVTCPRCQRTTAVAESRAGQLLECGECGDSFLAPAVQRPTAPQSRPVPDFLGRKLVLGVAWTLFIFLCISCPPIGVFHLAHAYYRRTAQRRAKVLAEGARKGGALNAIWEHAKLYW